MQTQSENPMLDNLADPIKLRNDETTSDLGAAGAVVWSVIAVGGFLGSYSHPAAGLLTILYLFALAQLGRSRKWRFSFYPGLAAGLVIAAVHLKFFWTIFSAGAVALWIVFAVWIGFFALLARCCLRAFPRWGWLAMPFVWTGFEYFRSELYYLKFSWLTPAAAFAGSTWQAPFGVLGSYGVGFVLMFIASIAALVFRRSKLLAGGVMAVGAGLFLAWGALDQRAMPEIAQPGFGKLRVAAVQLEFPTEKEVLDRLNAVVRKEPGADLVGLSENTFSEPIPEKVKDWCRREKRFLIAGGKQPLGNTNFENTVFVVAPNGEVVFKQTKAVPIQFFKDGVPASEQRVWNSPWGKIGICVCYDMSYSRVTDRLISMGAQALIVPTMDVADWGYDQHQLHARIAPLRAAEYRVPIIRVASSGISQLVDRKGRVFASAPFPGEGEILVGNVELGTPGSMPMDRWLAPFATVITLLLALTCAGQSFRNRVSDCGTCRGQNRSFRAAAGDGSLSA